MPGTVGPLATWPLSCSCPDNGHRPGGLGHRGPCALCLRLRLGPHWRTRRGGHLGLPSHRRHSPPGPSHPNARALPGPPLTSWVKGRSQSMEGVLWPDGLRWNGVVLRHLCSGVYLGLGCREKTEGHSPPHLPAPTQGEILNTGRGRGSLKPGGGEWEAPAELTLVLATPGPARGGSRRPRGPAGHGWPWVPWGGGEDGVVLVRPLPSSTEGGRNPNRSP